MEPTKASGVRYKLTLGKFQVQRVIKTATGFDFSLSFGQGVTVALSAPTPNADIREGDVLTLYTEVFCHAHPQPTSKQ